ncbi:hypothetical protein BEWA_013970 [Theileria equi strain WA]|uniref:Endoplasmic reticulum oxidoreductin n=1 Tax=Theileria equi strain WA TaxID=1537102 RepID=L1LCF8_THEEQ|nr:hypothetical protein BEWA_013970 [Theileria equi strain WA]EKX72838.1 hypothetical protein BEWA_013970 [Theileria equi strain WA]|eukprot:XP_004832290.1 hypothetical protein BEWA_013970 [Theileria equi strain WA]
MMKDEDSQSEEDSSDVPCKQSGHLHKLLSGMQSCISATAAWNYECINPVEAYELQTDLPRYHSNEDFFNSKLGNHQDRLDNLYYTFQTLLTATCRLFPVIAGFAKNCCSESPHLELQKALYEFLNARFISCQDFSVESEDTSSGVCCNSNKIQCLNHPLILEKFAKVTKIVECVDCEKCRLHGKIKLTALQIAIRAFSKDTPQVLERNEIVALLHGLDYYAQAILIIQRFRDKRKRQIMLYPIRVMLAVLVFLIVVYRKELYYAIFYCSLIEAVTDDHQPVVEYF